MERGLVGGYEVRAAAALAGVGALPTSEAAAFSLTAGTAAPPLPSPL